MILPSLLSLCLVLFCLTDSVKLKKSSWPVFSLASVLYPEPPQSTAVTKHLGFYCFKALLLSKERVLTRQKFLFRHLFESFSFLPVQTHRNILRWEWGAAGGDTACCGTVMESSINRTTPWQASWGHFGGHGDHRKRLICFLKVSSNIPSTTDIYIYWFVYCM